MINNNDMNHDGSASSSNNNHSSDRGQQQHNNNSNSKPAQQQVNNATAGETVYIGDFNVKGERNGPGELLWSNGDKYIGNFRAGFREGQGTLHFKDGMLGFWRCFWDNSSLFLFFSFL